MKKTFLHKTLSLLVCLLMGLAVFMTGCSGNTGSKTAEAQKDKPATTATDYRTT
jgi:PBP1b-binding outer membrane lipoprotein LpoB